MVKRVGGANCVNKHLLKLKQRKIALKSGKIVEKRELTLTNQHSNFDYISGVFRSPLDFVDPSLMWKNAAKGEK